MTLRAVGAASGGGGITIGTSTITGGTDTYVLYNNAGVVGNASTLRINSGTGQGPSIIAGTATTALAAFTITQTRNAAGVSFPGFTIVYTDTAVAGGTNAMQILGGAGGNVNLFTVNSAGSITSSGVVFSLSGAGSGVQVAAGGYYNWSGRCLVLSPADGSISLVNAAQTGFSFLQFGGTTSSFPSLKRSSAILIAQLADDSAAATLQGKFNSSDGTAGITFASQAVTAITVKDGLIVAKTP